MTTFAVWAPRPAQVELWLPPDRRLPLRRDEHGWWSAELDHTGRYAFVVDGDRLPDPRSPSQPDGVDGPSSTFDHTAFPWTDDRWTNRPLAGRVLYELHVGTFSPAGTFAGVAEQLDHLVGLGVDAIELMPVAEFAGRRGWGYDGVGLWAPHHAYGGPEGLQALVDACHARGLAVVLDVVYNHLGPVGNHLSRFGPYFTDRVHTPWGEAVNLDGPGSDEVRAFLVANAVSWVRDFHLDGLRLDAVHTMFDQSALPFLEELTAAVHAEGRRLGRTVWVIAESDLNDPRLVRTVDAGGLGLDAVWSDDFHHALHVALTGDRSGYYADFDGWTDLARAVEHVYVYDGRPSVHRGRRHGRAVGGMDRSRFLAYTQTHDQVGNRAGGDRPGTPATQVAAAALTLLGPFTPMLFQGEEWATATPFAYFTSFPDPELGRAVREGRMREFAAAGWDPATVLDPQDPGTFRASVLEWDEPERPVHAAVLAAYRALIALRRTMDPAAPASAEVHPDRFVMTRDGVTVEVGIPVPWLTVGRGGEVVLDSRRMPELAPFLGGAPEG